MHRSKVNEILTEAEAFIHTFKFALPPFAYWSAEEFQQRSAQARPVIEGRCGWDITDYGEGRFDELGLVLFTLRNGRLADLQAGRGMCYAEKLLISKRDQISPMHTHILKSEDIINRGGGDLIVQLCGSDDHGQCDPDQGGRVLCDGIERRYSGGEELRFKPGESITLMPGDWHAFWAEGEDVLIGEVSTVNDDEHDNIFRDPIGRFSSIIEDVPPTRLLVSDYDTWLS